MILVSFFSEDNVLSDEIKICYIFEYQSNENRAFHFFGGHPVYWPESKYNWCIIFYLFFSVYNKWNSWEFRRTVLLIGKSSQ